MAEGKQINHQLALKANYSTSSETQGQLVGRETKSKRAGQTLYGPVPNGRAYTRS